MNIGLVLSGGMAKGAYQIGALRALQKFIPLEEIKYISCASVGTLHAFAYYIGQLDRAERLWYEMCGEKSHVLITQIWKNELFKQRIKKISQMSEGIDIPFYTSLFDITNKAVLYKDLSKVSKDLIYDYLKASIAFPVYNSPVCIYKSKYYDGGLVDNIPVHPLLKHHLDYIICIYFDDVSYRFENPYFDNKIIKITFPGMSDIRQSLMLKKEDIPKMIQHGYRCASFVLNQTLDRGYTDLPYIYRSIEDMNKQFASTPFRLTTDAVITNLNKITSKYAKRKNVL